MSYFEIFSYKDCDQNHYSLSASQLQKLSSYKFQHDRNNYLIRQQRLKKLLKEKYNLLASIAYDDFGKIFIKNSNLNISLAHSCSYFVIATSLHKEVGIDIEEIREIDNIEQQALIFMNDNEYNFWHESDDKTSLFYHFWTAKEAILKLLGKGFLFDPQNLTLNFESKIIKAHISGIDLENLEIHYEKKDNHLICYVRI